MAPTPSARRPVTLLAVAEAAGVSTATASKALNGLPVSAANRERVRAAAEALGYVRNEAARTMRGGRTATVGLVINVDVDPQTELMAILHGLIGDIEASGHSVLISVVGGDREVDPLLHRLLERRVDGLVFWNAQGAAALEAYRRAGIPVLAVGDRGADCIDVPLIRAESEAVFDELYARLAALGHRRAVEIDPCHAEELHQAAARRHGVVFEERRAGHDVAAVREAIAALRAEPDPPTVLFASYAGAVTILAAVEELGLRVPEDLSVVAVTDSAGAALLRTPLSALRTDHERFGHAVATALLATMAGEEVGDIVVPDCIVWIERASLGPPPSPSRMPAKPRQRRR